MLVATTLVVVAGLGTAARPKSYRGPETNAGSLPQGKQREMKNTGHNRKRRKSDAKNSQVPRKRLRREKESEKEKNPFDVRAAMTKLTHRELQGLEEDITIINLNIGGLRSPYKKESIKDLASHLKFNIGIITETHLLDDEVEDLAIPGYTIIDKMGKRENSGGF